MNTDDQAQTGLKPHPRLALAASVLSWATLTVCYWRQPDWLAPVTLVPAWCWLVPALILTRLGFRRRQKRWCLVVLTLWAGFAVLFVEEARSVARLGNSPNAGWQEAREQGRAVRVVSLNCFVANARAAAEVAAYEPDVVLFQESPNREHLERLCRDFFGGDGAFIWGGDTAILARGHVQPHHVDGTSHFVHAAVELTSGFQANVISVRLNPPVFRLDFWSPGFWRDHRNNRIKHRRQIQDVMDEIEGIPQSRHLIIGGDLNAPPNDGALAPLRLRLVDTFRQAGRGWGNTGTDRFPLFRVDQIWASGSLRAESVFAQRTVHSDHRLVVCDLILQE
jgi:endonuclease/exonuclease/phosphatase (EEP) superfamily protein YafD